MLRVGFDGRDLLRKRTGVVNNTLHLARQLSAAHPSEVIVYVDRPARADEQPPAPCPWVPASPQVVTIHDLFAAVEPRWFAPRIGWQLRTTQRRAARSAS